MASESEMCQVAASISRSLSVFLSLVKRTDREREREKITVGSCHLLILKTDSSYAYVNGEYK